MGVVLPFALIVFVAVLIEELLEIVIILKDHVVVIFV